MYCPEIIDIDMDDDSDDIISREADRNGKGKVVEILFSL